MIIAVICMMISPIIQLQAQVVAEDDIIGVWLNKDKDQSVKIYKDGDKFYGEIVWLKDSLDPDTGEPKRDKNNPDPNLQTSSLLGLVILKDCVFDYDEWDAGTIYDHKNGSTFPCKLKFPDVNNLNKLQIQSYGSPPPSFGRTTIWTRKKN